MTASDGWSEADVALLDEADLLLGPVPTRPRRAPADADGRSTTWPSGSWRSGCRTARGAGARSSTGPARRPARDRLDCRECKVTVRHDHAHG